MTEIRGQMEDSGQRSDVMICFPLNKISLTASLSLKENKGNSRKAMQETVIIWAKHDVLESGW